MRTILIGSTGTIGKTLCSQLKKNRHNIIEGSRNSEHPINIDNPKSIDDFFSKIDSVDSIICTAGSASFGSLVKLTDEQIEQGLKSKLLGQINVVRKGISKLNAGGVIILTGGMLAYSPWPETSNIATVKAGIEGFVKAVALELNNERRILVIHPPLISETAELMGIDSAPWPNAAKVAGVYLNALNMRKNGEAVFVEGFYPA